MAITTLDGLIAGMKPVVGFQKASQTAEGAGTWHSLWKAAGYPVAGANPPLLSAGSGYQMTNATLGSLPFVNPTGGSLSYLARYGGACATIGTLILYDRLWACSGFGTVVTTLQSITTPGTIPSRDANGAALGAGVELWGEVYTAPGATGANWTATYTDEAGTSGQTSVYAHPANAETVGQMFPYPLAAGDLGVRAVASFQASASSGTAGDVGFTLIRRLAELPLTVANVAQVLDAVATGAARIYDSSCLALMMQCSATNTGALLGSMIYSQG